MNPSACVEGVANVEDRLKDDSEEEEEQEQDDDDNDNDDDYDYNFDDDDDDYRRGYKKKRRESFLGELFDF